MASVIDEMIQIIKQQDEQLNRSIAQGEQAGKMAQIACKALVWIYENPMAHPNNVRAVVEEALTKVKEVQ